MSEMIFCFECKSKDCSNKPENFGNSLAKKMPRF